MIPPLAILIASKYKHSCNEHEKQTAETEKLHTSGGCVALCWHQ
jgi:hypothetical protein